MIDVLVSVIIPTYNRAYCIEESVRSVLNQSFSNIELIIVDDCSKDNTEEVVQNIADSRIVYVKNDRNLGAAASRNRGALLAHGQLLAFNDSDDVWANDKLEKQIQCLFSQNTGIVFCRFRRKNSLGQTIAVIPDKENKLSFLCGDMFSLMLRSNVISTQTVVIKKELFQKLNGFNQELKALEDYELFLRSTKESRVAFVDEILVDSVDYGDGINDATKNALANVKALAYMAEEFKEDISESKISNCFLSNLPFFVQNMKTSDWIKLKKDELVFVGEVLERYVELQHSHISSLEQTTDQLNKWHAEKDETIRQLNEWNNEKDKTIQQLNEWHKEKDDTIQQLNEWHWEKDKTIQQLNEWHWEKDRYITELQEKIQKYENQ